VQPLLAAEAYLAPPKVIKNLTAGFSSQIASSLWLRAVGDLDYCENKLSENTCVARSWLFQVLDVATEVDRRFEAGLYQVAGLALSVVIGDFAGASVIFDRGVEEHRDNWRLLYAAAYHAHYEEKDLLKASQLYQRAAQNGAPEWTAVLAGRLATDGGDLLMAQRVLQTMIATNQDQKLIKRLQEKIASLKGP
jgi:hypothetical protein